VSDDVLISVENVSKKFAKRLRHAMWYGLRDLGRDVAGLEPRGGRLRTNEFWALQNISFELKRGECLCIIGPNGAGKSTLLKLLNGIIRPTQGRIRVRGRVGALIEVGAGFHPMLTGRENIYVNGAILGMGKREIDRKFDQIVEFADIGDFLDTPVKFYSSGMYVRLGFAIAAHMEPDILLIDEVLAVGDLSFRVKCYNAIARMLEHCAVLFVSHNLPHLHRTSTRSMVLSRGQVKFQGAVTAGIAAYEEMLEVGWNRQEVTSDRAKITRVEICSRGQAARPVHSYGQELQLYVDCLIAPEIPSFNVIVHFLDRSGDAVAEANSLALPGLISNPGGPCQLVVDLGRVPLAPGRYGISVTFLGGRNPCDHLCVAQQVCDLRIDNGPASNAPLLFPATFTVQEGGHTF
jgi:lipopolysaccharide transport system ATP-binding protein